MEDDRFPDTVEISTHAPLAGRDHLVPSEYKLYEISTHAPLAGRDIIAEHYCCRAYRFQPTRPLRGATCPRYGRRVFR